MEKLLARNDPDIFKKYITADEKGLKIKYDEWLKALYGTLNAELLFWGENKYWYL